MLNHRLQVLLDEEMWQRLVAEVMRRKASVSALVRKAIDAHFPVARTGGGRRFRPFSTPSQWMCWNTRPCRAKSTRLRSHGFAEKTIAGASSDR
jgi:hypothetical protein